MGIFESVARALSKIGPSDAQLAAQYEALRLRYVSTQDAGKATRLYDLMHGLDNEMVRRANKTYVRNNPGTSTRHREHGWHLPNND